MKGFEEKFPELKGKTGCIATMACEVSSCDCQEIQEELIEKHCISKQRVIETIKKINDNLKINERITDVSIGYAAIKDLVKELNLDPLLSANQKVKK